MTREERQRLRKLAVAASGVTMSNRASWRGRSVAFNKFIDACTPANIIALLDALDATERRIADETARAMALYLEDVR